MPKNSIQHILLTAGRIARYNEAAQASDQSDRHAKTFEKLGNLASQIADKADVIKRGYRDDGHKAGDAWTKEQVTSMTADISAVKKLLESNQSAFKDIVTGPHGYADIGTKRLVREITHYEAQERNSGERPDGRSQSSQVLGGEFTSKI